MTSIGIIGAGKLGIALAQAAVDAGLDAVLTSRDLDSTRLIAEIMAPGSRVGTLSEAAQADLVVLAFPLHRLRDLPRDAFDGKIVVDAVNYWEPVDGPVEKFGSAAGTSQLVQAHFPQARIVKSLNQLGYHDIEEGRRPAGSPDRLGVAVAGDDVEAKAAVSAVIDRLGFEAVDAGTLSDGVRLGPGGPAFGATLTAQALRRALGV